MSWLSTIIVGIVTAAIGCVLSGIVAQLAVRWYNISSFEGGSGYYVVAFALLGLVVGLAVGVVSSRVVASMNNPGFFKALGFSVPIILALVGVVGGIGRLRADVAPTLDGEQLMVMVEARWPESESPSPATIPGISTLTLASVSNHVQRKSVKGALWKEDAKLVDDYWVVPGAVYLFTEIGDRTIDIALNDSVSAGFLTRLPRRPGKEFLEWSEWYPKDGKDGPTRKTGVTYRYRVQKTSLPIRTEKLGGFEVGIIANGFQHEIADNTTTLDPYARFDVRYGGKPVQVTSSSYQPGEKVRIGMIAQLPSAKPAMIVMMAPETSDSFCTLLIDDNGTMREQPLSVCYNSIQAEELTSDSTRFAANKTVNAPRGRIDRHTYAGSSLLLFHTGVLDTRTLAFHIIKNETESQSRTNSNVPPLGLSPDEGSFAQYGTTNQSSEIPLLIVTDFVHGRTYDLPIDPLRMRFDGFPDLTPSWMLHHFAWERGTDGVDVLKERKNFVPIPYHGVIAATDSGQFVYNIARGGPALRAEFMKFLEREFAAKRESVEEDAYEYPVVVDGKKVRVASSRDNSFVLVQMAHGEGASDIVQRIGIAFNSVLATGKYDALLDKQ